MKKRYLIIIIVLLVLILGLSAGLAYTYFFTDIFKSNKQLFLKYIIQNSEISEIFQDKDLSAYIEKQKNTPYTSEGTIKTDVTFPDSSQAELAKALQNCSISFNSKTDSKNNYSYSNIKANYTDSESLNFEFLQNNDIYAFRINDVLNKFIGIQNNNLKDLARKFYADEKTISQIPDKFELNQVDFSSTFDDETIKQLINKYLSVITDNLTNDMFSNEKSEDNMVYTLAINQIQIKNIAIKLLETLKNDETFFNKIQELMTNQLKLSTDEANKYIEELKTSINTVLDKDSQSTDAIDTNSDTQLIIKVYAQKGKLTKTEFTLREPPSIDTNNSISSLYASSDNYKLTIFKTNDGARFEYTNSSKNENLFSLSIQKIKSDKDYKYDISATYCNKQLFQLVITFSGLNTDKVQESSELNVEFDSDKYILDDNIYTNNTIDNVTTPNKPKTKFLCTYINTKTFGTEVLRNDVTNDNILLVNTAPNAKSVTNLFSQVMDRFEKVNTEKMKNANINENQNPFIYYIPAIIPSSAPFIIQNKDNTYFTSSFVLGLGSSLITNIILLQKK